MELVKQSNQPLYQQLIDTIKKKIHEGTYRAGQQIPTEKELSQIYGVSRITVRRTVEELCRQGYLVKQQGKGTFVEAPRIYREIEQKNDSSFSETCRSCGREPGSHVLEYGEVLAEEWQAEFLDIQDKQKIYKVERVLTADNNPLILETIFFDSMVFPGFEPTQLENDSFYGYMEKKFGLRIPGNSRTTIEITMADGKTSELLQVPVGEPLMLLTSYINIERKKMISREAIVGSRYIISI